MLFNVIIVSRLNHNLTSGVAFDGELSRIGHGKGYYDSFIEKYIERSAALDFPRPLLCLYLYSEFVCLTWMFRQSFDSLGALALREQIIPAGTIPMAGHDHKMDVIMTADGLISSPSATQ